MSIQKIGLKSYSNKQNTPNKNTNFEGKKPEHHKKMNPFSRAAANALAAAMMIGAPMVMPQNANADGYVPTSGAYNGIVQNYDGINVQMDVMEQIFYQIIKTGKTGVAYDGPSTFEEWLPLVDDVSLSNAYDGYGDLVDMEPDEPTPPTPPNPPTPPTPDPDPDPVDPTPDTPKKHKPKPEPQQEVQKPAVKGLANALWVYPDKGTVQQSADMLRGGSFERFDINGAGLERGFQDQKGDAARVQYTKGIGNKNMGASIGVHAQYEDHNLGIPKTAIKLMDVGADAVVMPIKFRLLDNRLLIAPYISGSADFVNQDFELLGTTFSDDNDTMLGVGGGIAADFTDRANGLKLSTSAEYRSKYSQEGLFGDLEGVYLFAKGEKSFGKFGVEGNMDYRKLKGSPDEEALNLAAGPYLDLTDHLRVGAGVLEQVVKLDDTKYDSTKGYGKIEFNKDGSTFFVIGAGDGKDSEVKIGLSKTF